MDSDSGTPWWGLIVLTLIPAALAIATAWLVQARWVPNTEQRRRNEDRWEQHALELAEFLSGEFVRLTLIWAASGSPREGTSGCDDRARPQMA